MTDLELARQIYTALQAEWVRPSLPFTLEPGETGLCESKVGGTPYLPHDMAWPTDGTGNPMTFLAQINCGELTELPDFPHGGLLQFFIADDESYGYNYENLTDQTGFRILYHASVDTNVTMENAARKCPSPSEYSPLEGCPCRVRFSTAVQMPIPTDDFRFQAGFCARWNERRPDKPLKYFWEVYSFLPEDPFGIDGQDDEDNNPHHQLDGWPFFVQDDPRTQERYTDLDVLLFQLDSDWQNSRVCWGDCGVCNFFMSREALKKRDFSHVAYNWDCS